MDQNTYLGLMALSEGFGNLSNIGAGRPTQPSQVAPILMQRRQQEAKNARKMEAINALLGQGLGAAPTGGGGPQSGLMLPPGANPAALRALAGENPDFVLQELTKAQFQQPGNPYDRYKVVPGVGLVDLAGQNGAPGVAIPAREPAGPQRRIVRGPDGRDYYEDTQEPVLPNVAAPPPAPTSDERAIQDLMASDPRIDYATAVGIVRGRLKMDSFTGQVIDLATGQPWSGTAPAQRPAPQPGLASPPSGAPAAPGQAFMPPPIVRTEGADYPGATGGQGIVGNIANTIADFVGGNLPAPQQERAAQAFDSLRVRTMTTLQEAVPGRPSNMVIELLGQMTVEGGRITMGKERARERLSQTRDFIAQDVAKLNRIIDPANGFSRDQRANARMQLEDRTQLLSDYDAILRQFDAQAGGAFPKEAVDALLSGAGTDAQFDEIFGPGAAQRARAGR